MNHAQAYDHDQQEAARELARRLRGVAEGATAIMGEHALATAFLGVGVECALHHLPPAEVAEWLQSIADEIVKPDAGTMGSA